MISWCPFPLEVKTPLGNGYVLYVNEGKVFENDEWCVALKDTGEPRHFLSNQIHIVKNQTYKINENA